MVDKQIIEVVLVVSREEKSPTLCQVYQISNNIHRPPIQNRQEVSGINHYQALIFALEAMTADPSIVSVMDQACKPGVEIFSFARIKTQ